MQPTNKDFELAQVMLGHSLKVKPEEKVLISTSDSGAFPLVKAVYIESLKIGAYPLVDTMIDYAINRSYMNGFAYQFYKYANDWQMGYYPEEILKAKVDWADAYVRIVTQDNLSEFKNIDPEKIMRREKLSRPLMDKLIDKNRWVLTYYPTPSMAQAAGMSYDELYEFYFDSVLVDYKMMRQQLTSLQKVMDQGKKVRVTGEETRLEFSIENRLAEACFGERNIPDGEVFLAPLHRTLEGHIYFDMPTMYAGSEMQGIRLEFVKGKVVEATAEKGEESMLKLLNSDKGARYVGEFAVGANYNVTKPMLNTLFDEKIGGTLHMALGRAYKEKRGGGTNESVIHWDIVKDMRKKGSKIEVDGTVILENGKIKI